MGMTWENIRRLRKEAGLTQAALAEKLGMNRATISKYETGDICPPLPIVRRLCDILNCDFHDIVQSSEPPRQTTPESLHKIEELMGKEPGYLESDLPTELSETVKRIYRIKTAFDGMSQEGQEEATRRVEELARLPEYQKKSNTSLERAWNFGGGNDNAIDTQKDE